MERTKKTMSSSEWTVDVTINKIQYRKVVSDILVVGNDPLKISKNLTFLFRVYQEFFGRKHAKSQMSKNRLKVIKISLLKSLGESFSNQYD